MNFESAPFKLTPEYVDLMDGPESDKFEYFRSLLRVGIEEIKKNIDDLLSIITIMMKDSKMPCFQKPSTLCSEIKRRLNFKKNSEALSNHLIKASIDNWRTA